MRKKNKLLILGAMLTVASVSQSNEINNVFVPYSEENISFTEMVEKEVNDEIFVEFVDGDVVEAPEKNVKLEKIRKSKKNKKDKLKTYGVEENNYGVIANNIEELDEDFVISSKVFEMNEISDGLEPINRRTYAFNTQFDKKVAYPVSMVYGAVVPKPVRKGISNFYNNFKEVPTMVNSLLQLKPKKAVNALGRFVVNSTVGILGVNDVASKMGMKQDTETMGDTLGHYGIDTGSYLVLPALGPSTLRDSVGMIADSAMEGAVRGIAEDKLFFDTKIFDKDIYGGVRPVATGLNARSLIGFKYGDLNSPFEYDLVKMLYTNYRKLQVKK